MKTAGLRRGTFFAEEDTLKPLNQRHASGHKHNRVVTLAKAEDVLREGNTCLGGVEATEGKS